jgi:hypothetical protein
VSRRGLTLEHSFRNWNNKMSKTLVVPKTRVHRALTGEDARRSSACGGMGRPLIRCCVFLKELTRPLSVLGNAKVLLTRKFQTLARELCYLHTHAWWLQGRPLLNHQPPIARWQVLKDANTGGFPRKSGATARFVKIPTKTVRSLDGHGPDVSIMDEASRIKTFWQWSVVRSQLSVVP